MKTLNILLTGEGPRDFGWFDCAVGEWEEGAAAKLIRNCASEKDADRESGTRNEKNAVRKRFEEVHDSVWQGGNPSPEKTEVIPMVAMRMIESWLLSDIKVFQAVFGKRAIDRNPIALPVHPEMAWGNKNDPGSNYPKNILERICQKLERDSRAKMNREMYAELAENSDIDVMADKCPISFGTFRQEFQKYLGSVR